MIHGSHPDFSYINRDKRYRFALLMPTSDQPGLFLKGFHHQLQQCKAFEYTVDTYSLAESGMLKSRLLNQSYDLLICVDDTCTHTAKRMLAGLYSKTPLIFSSINDTSVANTHTGLNITGLSTPLSDYAKQMSLILSYVPAIKSILILQDPTDAIMQTVGSTLPSILKKAGYTVSLHSKQELLTRQDILDIAHHDMIILLSQHASEHYIQRLSLLCKEHKTVLYISDTTSVIHGASLGFGKDDHEIGSHIAETAHHILDTQTIPEVATIPYKIKLNLIALEQQGVDLIKLAPLFSLVNAAHVIAPSTQDKISAHLRLEQIPLE